MDERGFLEKLCPRASIRSAVSKITDTNSKVSKETSFQGIVKSGMKKAPEAQFSPPVGGSQRGAENMGVSRGGQGGTTFPTFHSFYPLRRTIAN
jgi:hypothetical protein